MFRQVLSSGSVALTLSRLGFGHLKPSFFVSTFRCSRQLLSSELFVCRPFHSVNFQLCYPLHRTVGHFVLHRGYTNDTKRHRSSVTYILATFIFMVGAAYAGVPLYRMICQVSMIKKYQCLTLCIFLYYLCTSNVYLCFCFSLGMCV